MDKINRVAANLARRNERSQAPEFLDADEEAPGAMILDEAEPDGAELEEEESAAAEAEKKIPWGSL